MGFILNTCSLSQSVKYCQFVVSFGVSHRCKNIYFLNIRRMGMSIGYNSEPHASVFDGWSNNVVKPKVWRGRRGDGNGQQDAGSFKEDSLRPVWHIVCCNKTVPGSTLSFHPVPIQIVCVHKVNQTVMFPPLQPMSFDIDRSV